MSYDHAKGRVRVRWDQLRVGDIVDMRPQPNLTVVSRRYNDRAGIWMLGFLHTTWRRIWRIGYIGHHEEEVVLRWQGTAEEFIERELVLWMDYALDLRDLLDHQNRGLLRAARERDRLLKETS